MNDAVCAICGTYTNEPYEIEITKIRPHFELQPAYEPRMLGGTICKRCAVEIAKDCLRKIKKHDERRALAQNKKGDISE